MPSSQTLRRDPRVRRLRRRSRQEEPTIASLVVMVEGLRRLVEAPRVESIACTRQEAADALGVSLDVITCATQSGRLPAKRVGKDPRSARAIRIPVDGLNAWFQEQPDF